MDEHNMQMIKTTEVITEWKKVKMQINITIKSSYLMKTIIEHGATLENNSDIEVKVTQTKSSLAFV